MLSKERRKSAIEILEFTKDLLINREKLFKDMRKIFFSKTRGPGMTNCVDCANFKMKKGWRYAYCSLGLITYTNPPYKIRLFMVKRASDGKQLTRLAILSKPCGAYLSSM